jgi:hypothetical protein
MILTFSVFLKASFYSLTSDSQSSSTSVGLTLVSQLGCKDKGINVCNQTNFNNLPLQIF